MVPPDLATSDAGELYVVRVTGAVTTSGYFINQLTTRIEITMPNNKISPHLRRLPEFRT